MLNLQELDLQTVSVDQNSTLEKPFVKFEIKKELKELARDKCPGPNGFPLRFYQLYWHFMKADIMEVFDEFYNNGFLEWHLNTIFISLVLKDKGECTVNDFHPVTLFVNYL